MHMPASSYAAQHIHPQQTHSSEIQRGALLTCWCDRDLFALPDNRTLLFATSGMRLRTTPSTFSECANIHGIDRISAYDVILKVSPFTVNDG